MRESRVKNKNIRYNIISVFIYVIGIILIAQLFNLQIVQGKVFREQSNTRLTRDSKLQAARGDILDQSGNKLATTTLGYKLELYKTKLEAKELNESLLKIANLLEKNGDSYIDELPIKVEPFEFTINGETLANWKKDNKINDDATAEQAFERLKEKYKIEEDDNKEARKIMTLRYHINKAGYSSTKSVEISKSIGEVSLAQINEQSSNFPGINIVSEAKRSYPSGSLASHILGYIGQIGPEQLNGKEDIYNLNDIIGKTGIEYIFEDYLKGKDGIKQIDMAVDGTITDENIAKEAVAGSNVVLTIDANLQKVTEETLKNSIKEIANSEKVKITGGSVVVMKVKTGEILAMASYPDFDPSDFARGISDEKWTYYTNTEKSEYAKNHPFVNRAISSPSSPGSTYKMVTAIAGLETGKIKLNEKINDVGRYTYYKDYQPYCWNKSGHGYLNVTQAIIHSCNYFFYEVGNRVGIQELGKYTKALGLGKKTNVELLSEEAGYVAGPETSKKLGITWNGGNTLAAAIGQENNNFTTIQMAKYTSIIANGGNDIDVSVIKSVVDAEGKEVDKNELNKYLKEKLGIEEDKEEKIKFNKANLNAVLKGMRGVTTESGGTAYSIFKNFNIEVGGKTGSAQTGRKDSNGKNITNAWFVGFAPFDEPEIAVVVMIENGQHGSEAATPARDIIAEYFGMNANVVTESMKAIPITEIQN